MGDPARVSGHELIATGFALGSSCEFAGDSVAAYSYTRRGRSNGVWRMKRVLNVAGVVFGVLLVLAGAVLAFALMTSQPTTGPRISAYAQPRSAILVVDIQEDFTGPNAVKPYRDGERLVQAANRLIQYAREKGMPVAYVINVIDNPVMKLLAGGMNAPGAKGTEMDQRITRLPGAKTFEKHRSDSLSVPELDAYLREQQVNQVYVVGLDAKYCINATIRGALNRGYEVTTLLDAVATESGTSIAELAQDWREAGARTVTLEEVLR
jgi:nicotinamidase-related amidase